MLNGTFSTDVLARTRTIDSSMDCILVSMAFWLLPITNKRPDSVHATSFQLIAPKDNPRDKRSTSILARRDIFLSNGISFIYRDLAYS